MRENIKLNRTPSTKEINAKRKLDEMFEATSNFSPKSKLNQSTISNFPKIKLF